MWKRKLLSGFYLNQAEIDNRSFGDSVADSYSEWLGFRSTDSIQRDTVDLIKIIAPQLSSADVESILHEAIALMQKWFAKKEKNVEIHFFETYKKQLKEIMQRAQDQYQ